MGSVNRRLFQNGEAVLLRNWPYVFRLASEPDSLTRNLMLYNFMTTVDIGKRHRTIITSYLKVFRFFGSQAGWDGHFYWG